MAKRRTRQDKNRDQVAFLSGFAVASAAAYIVYRILQPYIQTWLQVDRAAIEAGWEPYSPISGIKFTFWIFGAMVLYFFVWLAVARAVNRRLYRRQLQRVDQRMINDFTTAIPTAAYNLSPRQFEEETARIITIKTGLRTEAVGGAGDGGVDVKVYKDGGLVGIVQCKRTSPDRALPPAVIRETFAVKQKYLVPVAYLVTTGYVSEATKIEAERYGVKVIGGTEFENMRQSANKQVASTKRR